MTLSIAVLGAGRIGKVHAEAIGATPGARLVAVADAHVPSAEDLSARHGCRVSTIEEIVASADVDAVAICTPTDTHADLIERFARAGKPIFCEKPIDLSLERVRACLAVVEETGTPLMIGFNRRFDPHFAAVKRAIDDGRIGAVEQVALTSRDPGLPHLDYLPRSGGLFRDMTIHDFDMARFLLGEEVETVFAATSVLVDPRVGELGDVDTASVILRTASGRQAVITNSRRATYGYDQRIEVHGSAGMVSAQNQHEASIAMRRSLSVYEERRDAATPERMALTLAKGENALRVMEQRLAASPFLVGKTATLADIALYPYTATAPEGGFDLQPFPAVREWLARVEALPGWQPSTWLPDA